MALPDARDDSADFLKWQRYFRSALNADDLTRHLVPLVDESIRDVREKRLAVEDAEGAALDAMARRNFLNRRGDARVVGWRNELAGVTGASHPTMQDVFPRGVRHVTAPAGDEQVQRLGELLVDLEQALQAPRLQTEARKDKIVRLLDEGRALVGAYLDELKPAVAAHTQAEAAEDHARAALRVAKEAAVARAGELLGQLRALNGGSEEAAQSYTLPGKPRKRDEPPAAPPAPPQPTA